ncbi:MAG: transporter related protein, partial [Solirubrobacterales bacterium]|nr:transporter related protein [Solirubrobacterales bacterium]
PKAEADVDAIALRDVFKDLGGHRVLDGVTLAAPEGRTTVLMGPSGAGKTTIVKHVLGQLRPDRGDVLVDGRDLAAMSDAELTSARRRFGVLLQGSSLFDCGLFGALSLHDNLTFALRESGRAAGRAADMTAARWLREVGLLDHADKFPEEISAGMRKRAGLARALATEAPLVVLDDLQAGLDGVRTNLLCELIARVRDERDATFLVTTHSREVARRLADVLVVINGGRVVAHGPGDELLTESSAPGEFTHQFLRGDGYARIQLAREVPRSEAEPGWAREPAAPWRLAAIAIAIVLLVALAIVLLLPQFGADRVLSPI